MKLSETAIRRPVLTTMAFAALVVFGLVAYVSLGMALYPDVDMPMVTVTVQYEGASPQTVETEVTEILEESLSTISGIKSMRSETSEGVVQVFLEFELKRDVDVAAQDVRDKIAGIRGQLPSDSEAPVVEKFDPDSAPILGIVLAGNASIRDLTVFADDVVKPRIESINGVGGVQLTGDREREIRVWLRIDDLIAHGISAQDVIDTLRKSNTEFPGGRVETGQRELVVKTRGKVRSVEQFKRLVVKEDQGKVVRLEQVANIEDGLEDQRSMARLNGQPAISLSVRQQSGTNMVGIANEAKAELAKIEADLPDGYELLIVQDNSEFVESSTNEAQGELLRGGALAVLVILLFLRSLRGSLVAAVTIPATIISTYAFMLALGFSLNTMTLLALTISVGMIIDDSIVVLENTWRHMQEGKTRFEAAIAAMNEIGFAVIATSLSIAAVFVPVAFMEGLVGQFFYEFGMTVTFAVIVSTLIALFLSPMLCSKILKLSNTEGRFYKISESILGGIETVYSGLLGFALKRRLLIVLAAIGVFAGSVMLLPLIGQEFAPTADEGQFQVQVEAPTGSSIGQTSKIAYEIEEIMATLPAIKDIYTTVGGQYEGQTTVAQVMVRMVDKSGRTVSQDDVMGMARERLQRFSHLRISVDAVARLGGGGMRSAPIQYNLRGDDLDQLDATASQIVERLKERPGFVDVNTTMQSGKPELSIEINRNRASDLGVNIDELGRAVNTLIGGQQVSTFEDAGENIDVRVRLVGSQRDQAESLAILPVPMRGDRLTELRTVASIDNSFGPVSIERQDRRRQVTILANLEGGKALGEAVQEVESVASDVGLPDGVTGVFTGTADMMAESFASIIFALVLAVVLTYMVLAAQFESYLHPFTIMLSLPLSIGGALGGLALTGRTLNIFSMIGMVMLMGLVTKNAILLVDYTNLLRSRGLNKDDALRKAGPTRLRPILMTAFSTIAGMIPITLGLGDGAESRAPMGTCVVGGMLTSTILTLVVIPVVYSLIDDLSGWFSRLFSLRPKENTPSQAEEESGTPASSPASAPHTNGRSERELEPLASTRTHQHNGTAVAVNTK
ncbi:efflux RND transporter permease subunit [Rubinisphaera brasiliensis]|uniref:Acriflavin resistance protein n=1 Tax=Rubinisphaera brasiliensis (strain ATCC 49424 / DSM 5305 / JCM 21570 / IAM 15109 / NBRC 103401 / IFAM 1448) TaxID=756272 RepID=F0SJ21_RUBBR|nr:efflux RND transporter permease subunit [Rubinisphaera brasiliensis]ADY58563.1 acriflavin resistance protein [Rubinisphaera brasiliensis DSM 5305]